MEEVCQEDRMTMEIRMDKQQRQDAHENDKDILLPRYYLSYFRIEDDQG